MHGKTVGAPCAPTVSFYASRRRSDVVGYFIPYSAR